MTRSQPSSPPTADRVRIDKWLWAARFYKTRALARDAVEAGQVRLNGARVKPARELKVGDRLTILAGGQTWAVTVLGVSEQRGPAPVARLLHAEDAASRLAREARLAERKLASEPGEAIRGRPTKRDRRLIHRFREGG